MTPKEEAILELTGLDSMEDLSGTEIHVPLKTAMEMYDRGYDALSVAAAKENALFDAYAKGKKDGEDRAYHRTAVELVSVYYNSSPKWHFWNRRNARVKEYIDRFWQEHNSAGCILADVQQIARLKETGTV